MTPARRHGRQSLNRLVSAALDAALDDGQPRKRGGSPTRALVTGAAIATVARVAMRRADRHPLAVVDALRDRIGGHDFLDEDVDAEAELDDEYEDEPEEEEEEEEDDEEEEDEPEDDEPDEPEDEFGDEPEDEFGDESGDDFDDESGDEFDEDELPEGDGRLDPAARPPEPPPGRDDKEKATAGRG